MKPAHSTLLLALLSTLASCRARRAGAEELPPLSVAPAPAGPEAGPPPSGLRPPRPLVDDGIFYVLGPDPAHPRVRYLDGQLSLNESCAVQLGNKLGRRIPPVYVNGQPIGFC